MQGEKEWESASNAVGGYSDSSRDSGQTITIARDEFGANSRDIQRVMNDEMKATPRVM